MVIADKIVDALLENAPLPPPGVFAKQEGWKTLYSAQCPQCDHIHGYFKTYADAAANKMCKWCRRSYVEKMQKAIATGKPLIKKPHKKR